MRPRIPWLTRVDIITLEYLDGHEQSDFEQSPSLIATNIGKSAGHVRRRLRVLAASELIERTNDTAGYYAITNLGQRYLRGELTKTEITSLQQFDPDTY